MELIDWLQHWDEMRFYYRSGFSWLVLLPVYLGGLVLLGFLAWLVGKVTKRIWAALVVVVVLLPVLAIAPWWEELGIAYNFGQLCKKDAGIFVYKTVEVEGFYDDTTHWWRQLAESGYQFVESRERGPNILWRVERDGEKLKHFKIDQPTARYHYQELASHLPMSHQVKKFERVVVDQENGDVLGRYLNYYRGAPWFYIGLDRPTIPCVEARDGLAEGRSMLVWQSVLLPKK